MKKIIALLSLAALAFAVVPAKAEISEIIVGLASRGTAILLISSEMEEVLGLSHRVGVMHDGRLAGVLDRSRATQHAVIRLATGGAA